MSELDSEYRAYLIRMWRDDAQDPWRVSLEDPRTGRAFRFSSLQETMAFLALPPPPPDQMDNASRPDG